MQTLMLRYNIKDGTPSVNRTKTNSAWKQKQKRVSGRGRGGERDSDRDRDKERKKSVSLKQSKIENRIIGKKREHKHECDVMQ